MDKIKIAVVDDHQLFRSGLVKLIHSLGDLYEVVNESSNGEEFLNFLDQSETPEIALVDISMPIMDGYATAEVLQNKFPELKVLIVTMNEDEYALIRMLKLGVKGYISKGIEPDELRIALKEIIEKGFYYTDQITGHLINALKSPNEVIDKKELLNDRELKFIELACSEDTYDKIADIMCLSVKTIDGYRASVFEKLHVRSRVGLAIYAIKTGLFDIKK